MKVIDLTLTVSEKIPTFPGSPKPHFIEWETIPKDGYNLELLFLSTHTGTHIDAPFHFVKNGKKVHEIAPERLVNEAVLIRIGKNSNRSISKIDIQNFEQKKRFDMFLNQLPAIKGCMANSAGIFLGSEGLNFTVFFFFEKSLIFRCYYP